jgi:hypothetical protein
VTHPEAVVRKNKRPLAEAWVRGLLQRSDAATIRHLPPDDRDLIAWGVACALGETGVGPSGQAVPRAKELERAAELRKAV